MPPIHLRTLHLPGLAPFTFPPHREGEARPAAAGPEAVTGGGIVVLVDRERGVVGAGWGADAAEGMHPVEPGASEGPGEPPHGAPSHGGPASRLLLLPGGWMRTSPGGDVERGIVLDAFPLVIIQEEGPQGTRSRALAPESLSEDAVRRAAAHLPGHALRRLARGEADRSAGGGPGEGLGLQVRWGAAPSPPDLVGESLAALDEASLQDPARPPHPLPPGEPALLLAGIAEGTPRFLTGSARGEVALGALAGGRWALARALLEALLAEDDPSDATLLLVATRWATWTGTGELLRGHAGTLDQAARRFTRRLVDRAEGADAVGVAGLPAAFPSAPSLLEGFADAMEPLGDRGWTAELRAMAREVEQTLLAHRTGGGGKGPRGKIRLPVVGQPPLEPDTPVGPRPREPVLPPVGAFASPWEPSLRPRRTLHAARLVRSAVEGLLGARPDASYGRIRLAPDLASLPPGPGGVRSLVASGIRLADARLDLVCRFDGAACSLRVSQVGGRVPVNVVFEPRLPMEAVERVRFGGEDADVEIEKLEGSVRLRFQFPLDPERSVTVD